VSPRAGAVHVVGGGLAGCEAALQLARLGLPVVLHEMRPDCQTPAHRTGQLAEIVCSNSLKSLAPATASGLLKAELDRLGCRLLGAARRAAVPAGAPLAVDRAAVSTEGATLLAAEPLITVERGEVTALPAGAAAAWIVATGPLTSPALLAEVERLSGRAGLHFFDAIAPTVTRESLDETRLYRAARYDRGEADYLNAAFDEAAYRAFYDALMGAERASMHAFDRGDLFQGCQPIEEIAASGPDTLAFGPLRPVGLRDPRTGRRPFAVVQLRQENREATLYGLVGFQTRLKWGEQGRVFRLIPGLEAAEFVRYGQLHRNFYLDTPRALAAGFALPNRPDIRFAGQVTGVEGYVESIASGLVTAWLAAADLRGETLPSWPRETVLGALLFDFLYDATAPRLSPMNANFGLLPSLPAPPRSREARNLARAARALAALETFLTQPAPARLLAGSGAG
jgi:methylenetetrahydrofolate--tRNA-(uracil-5-)-methyltransferase